MPAGKGGSRPRRCGTNQARDKITRSIPWIGRGKYLCFFFGKYFFQIWSFIASGLISLCVWDTTVHYFVKTYLMRSSNNSGGGYPLYPLGLRVKRSPIVLLLCVDGGFVREGAQNLDHGWLVSS